MTLIVSPKDFESKKKLQQLLNEGRIGIHEPSIMNEWVKPASDLPVGFKGVVTNHPLRTKFAQIEKTATGWKVK